MRFRQMRRPDAHGPPGEERPSHLHMQMRLAGTPQDDDLFPSMKSYRIAARTGGAKGDKSMEHKTRTKALSWLLSLVLMLSLLPGISIPARAESISNVSYLYYENEAAAIAGTTKTGTQNCTKVDASESTVTWNAGWYVVSETVEISGRITVSGTVNLILCDNCMLTASKGITVSNGNSLTIYAQSEGNSAGALTIAIPSSTSTDRNAGIGGEDSNGKRDCGTVTINGGNINTSGGNYGAGIGGGSGGNGGTVTINGGAVTANGGYFAAGIGGGDYSTSSGNGGNGGIVTINGGTVTANGGQIAAGIGGGYKGASGTISITGGTVAANGNVLTIGGEGGAGIGGGKNGNNSGTGNSISITGGTVTATVQHNSPGAAIGNGGGDNATDCSVNIVAGATIVAGANKEGTDATTKTATDIANNTAYKYVKIESVVNVTGVDLNKASTILAVGDTEALTATVSPANATDKTVSWASSNEAVATVSNTGVVTAVATGTANITATTTDGSKTATCAVTVHTHNLTYELSNNGKTITARCTAENCPLTDATATVTIADTDNGTVTAEIPTAQSESQTVTLTVTPDDGYGIQSITTTDGAITQTASTYQLTVGTGDATVTAVFSELTTYTIFYRASGNPSSVKFKMTDSGAGSNMTNSAKLGNIDCWAIQITAAGGRESFPVAFQEDDGTWGNLTEWTVKNDIPNDLTEGSAVIVEGEAKAFIASFLWGDIEMDDDSGSYQAVDGGSKNFLVTNNTTSVTVPVPTKTGYTFLGWEYFVGQNAHTTGTSETVSLSQIHETTIFFARWQPSKCKVEFYGDTLLNDLTINDITYNSLITAPSQNPEKEGYAFDGWVVAEDTTQIINEKESFISAGTPFDFSGTKIVNDLKLRAAWRHVHSYVCLTLDHSIFGGAFASYIDAGYDKYAHIKLCTGLDDFCVEAHSYVNGKCACGAEKPIPEVTLTKTVGEEDPATVQVKQDSVVVVTAPQKKGSSKFSEWQYSSDGENWRTLSTGASTAFVIPSDLEIKAVYEAPKAELRLESFDYNGKIAFGMSYKVPDGYTVVDGGILTGNNSHIGYMAVKQLTANVSGLADIMFPYIPSTEMPIHYDPATDDATVKFGAAKVAEKMFREEALNISGKSNPIFKKVSVLGKTGTAAMSIATSADNIYYYGMGYVICKAPNGSYVSFATDAIAATLSNPDHSIKANINVQ